MRPHAAGTRANFPLRQLLLALQRAEAVALRLAQQLLVIAQPFGCHLSAHRAARLMLVPAIAKAALRHEFGDIDESRRQRILAGVEPQRAQPRRVDDARTFGRAMQGA